MHSITSHIITLLHSDVNTSEVTFNYDSQVDGTPPWKPSAWTFAMHWQSKAKISNSSSPWAPPSPSPWTPRRAGTPCQQGTSKDQWKAHLLSRGMQNENRNSWYGNLAWNPTRHLLRKMKHFSVTTVKLNSRLEMVWKFTLERRTRKLQDLLRNCVVNHLPNLPSLCLP